MHVSSKRMMKWEGEIDSNTSGHWSLVEEISKWFNDKTRERGG
jgi:hypothetical protein